MNDKNKKLQFALLGIAIILAAGVYLLLSISRSPVNKEVKTTDTEFSAAHYNTMKTDTFVALIQKAYGNQARTKIEQQKLTVEMVKNAQSKEFYNNNDALLHMGLSDYGFNINYNTGTQTLLATFAISKQNGVNVPNDVLLKIMDKTAISNHVNQQK